MSLSGRTEGRLTNKRKYNDEVDTIVGAGHKKDPLTMLNNDEIIIEIISFFIGKRPTENGETVQNETPWLRKVLGKIPTTLMAVSTLWRSTLNRVLPLAIGPVAVNLTDFEPWSSYLVHWMGRINGIKVLSLKIPFAELGDIPYLGTLTASCDTQDLTSLELSINKTRRESTRLAEFSLESSKTFRKGVLHPYKCGGQLIFDVFDLTGQVDDPNQETRAPEIHVTEMKTFHTHVAQQCPNLKELTVTMTFPLYYLDYSNYISQALFSMPSIQVLNVSFGYHGSYPGDNNIEPTIDSSVITKLVQNLPGLKSLKLSSPNIFRLDIVRMEHCVLRRYHIESASLEHIDTTELGKKMMVSCNCPQLKSFRCRGSEYGNGTKPLLSSSQFASLEMEDNLSYGGDLVVPAGTFEFPHFDVPDSCEMTLESFCAFWDPDFERYSHLARQAADAQYQAF